MFQNAAGSSKGARRQGELRNYEAVARLHACSYTHTYSYDIILHIEPQGAAYFSLNILFSLRGVLLNEFHLERSLQDMLFSHPAEVPRLG